MESSHYLPSGIEYEVAPRDVIPLFDQLYFVHIVGPESVNLKRVTENVPAEFRPQMDSRKISTADYIPSLFVRHDPIHKGRQFLDEVTLLNFDAKLGTVDVKLSPREIVRGIVPSSPAMPETHRVKKGELLTARGRSYKVLNVVPPQTITNVGKLVGWIELAADPEKEPAK